jgi:hypothetical protein
VVLLVEIAVDWESFSKGAEHPHWLQD